jgi:hypothetical protein
MTRTIILAALAIGLTGCSQDRRETPTHVCLEREVISGKCVRSEYRCNAPMVLVPHQGGVLCSIEDTTGKIIP